MIGITMRVWSNYDSLKVANCCVIQLNIIRVNTAAVPIDTCSLHNFYRDINFIKYGMKNIHVTPFVIPYSGQIRNTIDSIK